MSKVGPRIYNLFPRLVGSMDRWPGHLPRIREMGFDWVYVNPWHYAGYSGSLYAVKDYYDYHPLLVNANLETTGEQQLQAFIDAAHAQGLKVMMDLVVNHTAFDSVIAAEHPEWFEQDAEGHLKRPGAMDGDVWVEWGDLVQVNNAGGPDQLGLWNYWLGVMRHYLRMGVDGFRADAAYHVPAALWEHLITGIHQEFPTAEFFAETLGCRPWELIACADAGFDYVFNSVRWWDFDQAWFLEGHARTFGVAPSIGFPESHDTERAAAELDGNVDALIQKYAMAALTGTGVMIPVGFEHGFRTRLDVVNTYPDQWEEPSLDLTSRRRRLLECGDGPPTAAVTAAAADWRTPADCA
jgi:starch synthase (maltosyl-transferring)